MDHNEYVAFSEDVAEQLNDHVESFCEGNPEFRSVSEEYAEKRIHLIGIQCYAGFRASGTDEEFSDFLNIPIVIESVMLMAYKTNQILDHKKEVWGSEKRIEQNVLGEGIYTAFIIDLLQDSEQALGEKYGVVKEKILTLTSKMYKGFWYEKNFLNVHHSSLEEVLEEWESKYERRNNLLNGVYDYASLIGYYMGSGNESVFDEYERYFADKDKVSHSGQIVNDLSDFSAVHDENVKSYQDAFSDIRNGIITQPTYELLDADIIVEALEDPDVTRKPGWRKEVKAMLVGQDIVEEIRNRTEASYDQHVSFWSDCMDVESDLLFHTYSYLRRNKYYHKFQKV